MMDTYKYDYIYINEWFLNICAVQNLQQREHNVHNVSLFPEILNFRNIM